MWETRKNLFTERNKVTVYYMYCMLWS